MKSNPTLIFTEEVIQKINDMFIKITTKPGPFAKLGGGDGVMAPPLFLKSYFFRDVFLEICFHVIL